jgi:hypothetical protein
MKNLPIKSNLQTNMITRWLGAMIWNGLCWPAAYFAYPQFLAFAELQTWAYLFALFPPLGLLIIKQAIDETRLWLRYKEAEVIVRQPGVAGSLLLPKRASLQTASIALTCYRRYLCRDGGETEFRIAPLWRDQGLFPCKIQGDKLRFDFAFKPTSEPPSGKQGEDFIYWQISLSLPGRQQLTFDFPVAAHALASTQATNQTTPNTSLPKQKTVFSGADFESDPQHNRWIALIFTLFSLLLTYIGYELSALSQQFALLSTTIIAYSSYLCALICLAIGCYTLFYRYTVALSASGVCKQSQMLMLHFTDAVVHEAIVDIRIHQNGFRIGNNGTRVFYALKLLRNDLPELEIANGLEGYSAAQALRAHMLSALNIPGNDQAADAATPAKLPIPAWLMRLRNAAKWLKLLISSAIVYDIACRLLQLS